MINLLYSLACLCFCIMIGGAVYEHTSVVPQWAAAPPASLSMFQGEYGLNPAPFWQSIHPVTLIFLIISLVLNWKGARRNHILYVLIPYFLILVITAIYFVPELMAITNTAFANTVNADLTRRAKTWEILSLVRLAVLIGMAVFLLRGLTKDTSRRLSRNRL